ncbi:Band 7 protein [Lentisphaera araneosa HTCC2155]|uniref:Band 7 protein n=1 Tax=Lentisphaera araneosa HTCC2155 TaxID=313628 RepID=A6DJY2_9BACT|nr:protease modulator HflK [Lentisphaera araneosa]EDM28206.1 Band 7 protein [Lentisphaera araneosa HTCC2155]
MNSKEKFSKVHFVSLLAIVASLVLTSSLYALKLWYPIEIFSTFIYLGAFTLLVGGIAWQSNRLEAKLIEYGQQAKKASGDALFEEEEGTDLAFAKRSLMFFERYVVSVFCFAVGIGALVGIYYFWSRLATDPELALDKRSSNAAAMMMGLAAGYFIFASYAGGVSRDVGSSKLRALSGWFYCSAIMLFVLGVFEITSALELFDYRKQVNYAFVVIIAILAIEMVLGIVMESFRPRHSEEERAFLLESRMLTVMTSPGGLASNIVHVIEYQTGIHVSENSFNIVFKKVLLPILAVQAGWLYLMTTMVEIKPGYAGVRENFGKISRDAGGEVVQLQPGLNFKLPWPMGKISIYNVDKLSTFTVGQVKSATSALGEPPMEEDEYKISNEEKVNVWGRKSHGAHEEGYEDFNYLASDAASEKSNMNMLTIKVPVHYKVKDIYEYLYNYKEPQLVLQSLAEQELVSYIGQADYSAFMGNDRTQAADQLKKVLQEKADAIDLGVNVVFLEIEASHPPVDTVLSHDRVMGAVFESDAKIFKAQTKAKREVSAASSYKLQMIEEAKTEKVQRIAFARAQSERFTIQQRIYGKAPGIFKLVSYLDFIERDLNGVPKYIFNSPKAAKNIIINFENNKNIGLLKSLSVEED